MSYRTPTRADDETILDMLMQRHEGRSSYDIARAFGKKPQHIRTVLNRVRAADEKESGENTAGCYW